jgi:hypothetical protein
MVTAVVGRQPRHAVAHCVQVTQDHLVTLLLLLLLLLLLGLG